jgi:hypothetical protein
VSQSFPSVFPLLSVGTMATCEGCCHLTGVMLNLAAEAADRARINACYVFDYIERDHAQFREESSWSLPARDRPVKCATHLHRLLKDWNALIFINSDTLFHKEVAFLINKVRFHCYTNPSRSPPE